MLIVSLFRDFINVNQYPGDEFDQGSSSFRLPQNFWVDSRIQQSILFEVFSFVGSELDLHLTSNRDLLPSSLSSDFSKYILFSSEISKLSSGFTATFDKVVERSFVGFEPIFDKLEDDSYIYIDFDVDSIGFFCGAEEKKWGGYFELSLQDYLKDGIEEFFARPLVHQSSKLMMSVLNIALLKVHGALRHNGIDTKSIRKVILGGAYRTYFDTLELRSLSNWKRLFNFDAIEKDSSYRILCGKLL